MFTVRSTLRGKSSPDRLLQDTEHSELRQRNLRRNSSSTSQVHSWPAWILGGGCQACACAEYAFQTRCILIVHHVCFRYRAAHRCCGSWRAAGLHVAAAPAWGEHRQRPPTQQAQQTAQRRRRCRRRCRRSARRQPLPLASMVCARQLAHLLRVCRWPLAIRLAHLQPGQPCRLRPRPHRQLGARTRCRQTVVSRTVRSDAIPPARQATRPQHATTWSRCAFRHGLLRQYSATV
jgi:hypothetical protein